MSIIMRFITSSFPETLPVKAKAEATHHLFKVEPTSTSALDRANLGARRVQTLHLVYIQLFLNWVDLTKYPGISGK